VGPAGARSIMHTLGVRSAATDPIRMLVASLPRVADGARAAVDALRATLADCSPQLSGGSDPLTPATELARIRQFVEPIILERYASAQARLADLEQLEQVASAYSSRSR